MHLLYIRSNASASGRKKMIPAKWLPAGWRAFNSTLLFLLLLLHSLLNSADAPAQTFGNEWINYNQQYWKIPTTRTGMYRLTKNDLQAAGFPVTTVDPRRIQLFHRGQEQAIFVSGEGDAVFNQSDFVEFYGQRNDGTLNAELYLYGKEMPHSHYNLYSDTTAYFITWRLDNGFGKRMEDFYEANVTNIPAESFHLDESFRMFTNQYSVGQRYQPGSLSNLAEYGHYDTGEGWTGLSVNKFNSITDTLKGIRNMVTTTVKPNLEVLVAGRINLPHNVEIFAGPPGSPLRSLGTMQFSFFATKLFTSQLEWSDISATGEVAVRMRVNGFSGPNNDAASISYIRLSYPQAFDAGGANSKYFYLPPNPASKSYFEISNPAAQAVLYDVTNTHSVRRISTNTGNGRLTAVTDRTASGLTLFFTNQTVATPLSIQRVRFRNINPATPNFIIISHKSLMKPAGGHADAVKAYAAYRSSAAGGRYDTLVVDVDLLYNQFSYGELTPLAIRRFSDFLLKRGKPEFLLLIGQSQYPFRMRNDPNRYLKDLVPTGGYPGSDVALTAGLEGMPFVPGIPTGRLSTVSPVHVINYLNKVIEHEATPAEALWRKNLLHLSGGRTQAELQLFKLFVDDFKWVAEGIYLGGKVTTLSKKTDNTVELINVSEQVNKGVGLITFFGHSGRGVTDIEIGSVSSDIQGYRNKGKYPMILVNGCEAGDIFSGDLTVGEDWILTADRGAILFMAHSGSGYSLPLKRYSDWFYNTAFGDSLYIGKPVGSIHKECIRRFADGITGYDLEMTHTELITLQGDPAVSIAPLTKPDYYTSGDQIFLKSFDNSAITAVTDSFQLGIIVSNFGSINRNKLPVTVRRVLGDGTTQAFDTLLYNPVYYQDTLFFTIRTNGLASGGSQRFEVYLDPKNTVAELNENNNNAILDYVLPSVGAVPLFPREYSIVSGQPVGFIAQSTAAPVRERNYLIELDTTSTFTSPGKRSTTLAAGLLPSWTTNLLSNAAAHDSTVYYWRIRYADQPEGLDNTWAASSFIYINGSPEGWSQSRFPQFSKAGLNKVVRNTAAEKWEFPEVTSRIRVTTYGPAYQAGSHQLVEFSINDGLAVFGGRCGTDNLLAVAFDKSTIRPYPVFPNLICGRDPLVTNFLSNSFLSVNGLGSYLDKVATGDYVLLFTTGTINFGTYAEVMRQTLLSIGADPAKIASLQNGFPYIIIGRKGAAPGTATEILADNNSGISPSAQSISLQTTLTGRSNSGFITSSVIGPASLWGTLYNKVLPSETAGSDKWRLEVLGTDLQGRESVVIDSVKGSPELLDFISSQQYPYLKLRLWVTDPANLTPPQLNKWQVIYDGVPEGLINPETHAASYQVADKYEGQEFSLPFVYQNVSPRNFTDSLTVQYSVLNLDSRRQQTFSFKIKPLAAGETITFSVPVRTAGMPGNNRLQVFVNPRVLPEQNFANNLMEVPFRVVRDNVHPILDVTFDGVRIMDGDIVAPSPLITVSLRDENRVQIRRDTVGLELYVKKPCQNCSFERINLSSTDVTWAPAGPENNFQLEYNPKNLPDGTYTLRVQGADISGNVSGTEPYLISFQVVNESRISHFYPYPNPFSTNTRFVFTLTGADIPDQIKIQIMTVSGKVVREITQDELGPVRIGNNISSYAWDGTDEFGDKLANGVYLYRVITKINGQSIEHRATAADKAFKNEYGKLYILR